MVAISRQYPFGAKQSIFFDKGTQPEIRHKIASLIKISDRLYAVKLSEHFTICIYTQTKKKRPIFMVLYLSIQLRYRKKNKTKMSIKRRTHKKW